MSKMSVSQWLWLLFVFVPSLALADTAHLDEAIHTQLEADKAAKRSQQKIDKLDDESAQMLAEYRGILKQTESLQAYNDQLQKLVNSQNNELESITLQLENIETTQREIVPMMLSMIRVLEKFIALDMPFLPAERQQRVEQLHILMERADVSLAEKYRRVLEAYQVETEYGRTIEAYQGELEKEGVTRTVDFLRIGRLSLYYLSLDGQEAGYWKDGWLTLDNDYRKEIEKGIKVAKKQLPPDLLVLPVNTQEQAQ